MERILIRDGRLDRQRCALLAKEEFFKHPLEPQLKMRFVTIYEIDRTLSTNFWPLASFSKTV